MKSSLVLCLLLGVVVSARAASVSVFPATETAPPTTALPTTMPPTTIPPTTMPPTTMPPTTLPPTTMPPTTLPPTTLPPTTLPPTTMPPTTMPPTTMPPTTLPPTTMPPTTVPVTSSPGCFTSTSTTTPYPTTQSSPTQSQIMCPEGWEVFMGRCYYFVSDSLNWPQAQSNCAMLGSMLVSVRSAQEYGFLQQFANNNEYEVSWLGGFYLQDQWLWLDGSWFYNSTWGSQSPGSSSPCLVLSSYEGWSNSPCINYEYPSICVKDSNVPPVMLCPEGWTGFHGRCYYHNNDFLSWHDADAHCASLDATLVSVHSPEEYSFLYQQTNDNDFYATWLGGFYLEDQWTWLDGSWFFQGFFAATSPYSTYPCLATYSADGWYNFDCDQTFRSFCVKDPVV